MGNILLKKKYKQVGFIRRATDKDPHSKYTLQFPLFSKSEGKYYLKIEHQNNQTETGEIKMMRVLLTKHLLTPIIYYGETEYNVYFFKNELSIETSYGARIAAMIKGKNEEHIPVYVKRKFGKKNYFIEKNGIIFPLLIQDENPENCVYIYVEGFDNEQFNIVSSEDEKFLLV